MSEAKMHKAAKATIEIFENWIYQNFVAKWQTWSIHNYGYTITIRMVLQNLLNGFSYFFRFENDWIVGEIGIITWFLYKFYFYFYFVSYYLMLTNPKHDPFSMQQQQQRKDLSAKIRFLLSTSVAILS